MLSEGRPGVDDVFSVRDGESAREYTTKALTDV